MWGGGGGGIIVDIMSTGEMAMHRPTRTLSLRVYI